MIFQDPYASLDPRMTVEDIISEPLRNYGLCSNDTERRQRVADLLTQVDLRPETAQRYPHEFSGGQRQRIGIARALAVDPECIFCDEPISALDVSVQVQIVNMLKRLQGERQLSYLFIAHDLSMVHHLSRRIGVMYLGSLVELGPSDAVFHRPSILIRRCSLRPCPDRILIIGERLLCQVKSPVPSMYRRAVSSIPAVPMVMNGVGEKCLFFVPSGKGASLPVTMRKEGRTDEKIYPVIHGHPHDRLSQRLRRRTAGYGELRLRSRTVPLDPAMTTALAESNTELQIFEGLTRLVDDVPQPALAKSWDISDDGRTYIFHLRDGIEWSDGTPITAGDIEYSWKRVVNPDVASENAYMLFCIDKAEDYFKKKPLPMKSGQSPRR